MNYIPILQYNIILEFINHHINHIIPKSTILAHVEDPLHIWKFNDYFYSLWDLFQMPFSWSCRRACLCLPDSFHYMWLNYLASINGYSVIIAIVLDDESFHVIEGDFALVFPVEDSSIGGDVGGGRVELLVHGSVKIHQHLACSYGFENSIFVFVIDIENFSSIVERGTVPRECTCAC